MQANAAVQDNKENANVAAMQALAAVKPKKATKKRAKASKKK